MDSAIDQVRRFNRTVTQRVGALDDGFLARGRPLGQARLLWEIGPEATELRVLRSRLGLDSGYLSRLLRALQADGLIEVDTAGGDGRVRLVRLTPGGLAERVVLDQRSDEQAAAILAPLTGRQRDRLVDAMAEVERLLVASMVQLAPADPRGPAATHCTRAYYAELARRFDGGFEPPAQSPPDPDELLLIATLHGEPVGAGTLDFPPDTSAVVHRLWVSEAVRGLGLGRRLLTALEAHAAGRGRSIVRLETNRALTEAIALYRSAGYREVAPFSDERYAHYWFEKRLTV